MSYTPHNSIQICEKHVRVKLLVESSTRSINYKM